MGEQTTLADLTHRELMAIYNQIPGANPVKKFDNNATAISRIQEALTRAGKTVRLGPGYNDFGIVDK